MAEKPLNRNQLKRMYIDKKTPINVMIYLLSADHKKIKKYLKLYNLTRKPLKKFGGKV